jgi:phage-related protein
VKGEIATFAVQFVCDSPYFEDGEDRVVPLYRRTKGLSTPFALPRSFGEIVAGGLVENKGNIPLEPIITIYYPNALEGVDGITIKNETTGKGITLDYSPEGEDTVVIDVKNRKITSKIAGSLLNNISDDTFLGDFVLERGNNEISVDLGNVAKGFSIECKFSNLYSEAVIC